MTPNLDDLLIQIKHRFFTTKCTLHNIQFNGTMFISWYNIDQINHHIAENWINAHASYLICKAQYKWKCDTLARHAYVNPFFQNPTNQPMKDRRPQSEFGSIQEAEAERGNRVTQALTGSMEWMPRTCLREVMEAGSHMGQGSQPLHMFCCPIWLHLQNTNSEIKWLRIPRWWPQSTKLQAQDPSERGALNSCTDRTPTKPALEMTVN